MNNNLNVEQNKRLLMRLANLNQKYKSNAVISNDFTETGSSYSMNVVTNNILGTNISSDMKIVDYKINMDGKLVIIGEGGNIVTEFNVGSGFYGNAYSIRQTTDGSYLIGGAFTSYSGKTANYIIKLKSDGGIDSSFNSGSGFDGGINEIIKTIDGGYLISGGFTSYSGQTANYIIKLKSNGGIDSSFNSGVGFDQYTNMSLQTTDGGYLIGGCFTTYSGQTANYIIKLKSDGSIDSSFNSGVGFNNEIYSLIQTSNNGYLIGGIFTAYSGQTANNIIKLKSDGSVDDTFNSGVGFDDYVMSLLNTTDGGYLIGGGFTTYSGQTANYIIKLRSDGSVDDTFNSGTGFNGSIASLLQTTDGGYLIGGNFTMYSGETVNHIIKLKSDGSIDSSFNSGTGFNEEIYSSLETSDGGYLMCGIFTSYSDQTVNHIIKLKSDGESVTISE